MAWGGAILDLLTFFALQDSLEDREDPFNLIIVLGNNNWCRLQERKQEVVFSEKNNIFYINPSFDRLDQKDESKE